MSAIENGLRKDAVDMAIQSIEARGGFTTTLTPEPEIVFDATSPVRKRRRAGRITGVALAGGLGVVLAGGLGAPMPVSASENSQAIVIEGQMDSLKLEAASAINIESAKKAAQRYGADAYSKDWHNWTIAEGGKAATLNPDQSGLAHRVRVNGAVIDGWLKVERAGITAIPVVVNPRGISYMDLQGGTFRLFSPTEREAAFNKLVGQMRAKEKIEQPGTNVMPVCVPLEKETRWVNPLRIPSAAVAALRYGADAYSRNKNNWEINEFGGAHLKDDPSGLAHRIKAPNAVVDGWLKINRAGITAIGIVGAPHGPNAYIYLDVNGATVWQPKAGDLNALHLQVKRQQAQNEKKQQPGVLSISVCN